MSPPDPIGDGPPRAGGALGDGAARERALLDALRRTEAGFREFIDRAPDAIFIRRGPHIVHVNDALLTLLGLRRDEVLGRDPVDVFVHPEHRAEVLEHRVRDPEGTDLREHVWVRKDGGVLVLEVVGVTVTFEGAPARIAMCRDLTERRRLQDRLFVAGQLATVGTLAAGMAHEINNPLSSLLANLRLIKADLAALGEGAGELREMLADALEGAERVRGIVDGMRTFSRTDAGRTERVELPRVVGTALTLAMSELRDRARVVTDFAPTPPVDANEGRLVQVLVNLLVNAAHALPPGHPGQHEVHVRTRTDGAGRAVVSIRDTGEGIPPERLSRIFDPFFTTRPAGKGSGLGLSISHNIVTGLGGELTVDSQVGAGSTFSVILPPARPT